jgi:hypothetical protein
MLEEKQSSTRAVARESKARLRHRQLSPQGLTSVFEPDEMAHDVCVQRQLTAGTVTQKKRATKLTAQGRNSLRQAVASMAQPHPMFPINHVHGPVMKGLTIIALYGVFELLLGFAMYDFEQATKVVVWLAREQFLGFGTNMILHVDGRKEQRERRRPGTWRMY